MHPCIFLIGLHGSGKTTLGRLLQKEHGFHHLSLGDIGRLARSMKIPREYSLRFVTAMARQEPATPLSPKVVSLLLAEIEHLRQFSPVSIDGFPAEPSHVHQLPTRSLLVHVVVPENIRQERLVKRSQDTKRQWIPGLRSYRDEALPVILTEASKLVLPVHNEGDCSQVAHWLASRARQAGESPSDVI